MCAEMGNTITETTHSPLHTLLSLTLSAHEDKLFYG